SADRFRAALAEFPAGVTIVTTTDAAGHPRGFTATSFSSLSARPPLVLVSLAATAECFEAFTGDVCFAIAFLDRSHAELASVFATRGADKFAGAAFELSPRHPPRLRDALVHLECRLTAAHPGGDHSILVGEVLDAAHREGEPLVYHRRGFCSVTGAAAAA